MQVKFPKVVALSCVSVALLFGVHVAAVDKTPPVSSCVSKSEREPQKAEDIFRLVVFLDKDNPLAGAAAADIAPDMFRDAKSRERYFYDISSLITPMGSVDNDIHPLDLQRLNQALGLYAIRNLPKTDTGQTQNALQAIVSVLSRTTELVPSQTMLVDNIKTLGVYKYFYVTLPLGGGLKDIRVALDMLRASNSNESFGNASKRVAAMDQALKAFAQKQRAFSKKKGWRESQQETADTRSYAKLFEEELPILRQQLTLLKSDIDKGFAELQKQQDAKAQSDKATPAQ